MTDALLVPVQPLARDDAVLQALTGFVERTSIGIGERLPTERFLALQLNVSRNTVREALTRWEGLGIVERRQGSGTYLKAHVSTDMLHLPLTLRGTAAAQGLLPTLQIRRALEAEAAALCAERATADDLDLIEDRLDTMERVFRDTAGTSSVADWDFHQAIYQASGNPLFGQIIDGMLTSFHRFWEHPLGIRDFGHASFPFHRTMFDRIAARDPDGARREALALIMTVEDDLKRGTAKLNGTT